jgi:hypothetical protein
MTREPDSVQKSEEKPKKVMPLTELISITEIKTMLKNLYMNDSIPVSMINTAFQEIGDNKEVYESFSLKFLKYLESNFGKAMDKKTYTHLLEKFLIIISSGPFLKLAKKKPNSKWKEIESILGNSFRERKYAIGFNEFAEV